jgi:hypothetical protein
VGGVGAQGGKAAPGGKAANGKPGVPAVGKAAEVAKP